MLINHVFIVICGHFGYYSSFIRTFDNNIRVFCHSFQIEPFFLNKFAVQVLFWCLLVLIRQRSRSRSLSLFLCVKNFPVSLTKDSCFSSLWEFSLSSELWKHSISRSLSTKLWIWLFNLILFFKGVGLKFKPRSNILTWYLDNACFDKLKIFGWLKSESHLPKKFVLFALLNAL